MFQYDDENPMHRRALAAAILAVEAQDLVVYDPTECKLAPEAEARMWATMARAGCTLDQAAASKRSN